MEMGNRLNQILGADNILIVNDGDAIIVSIDGVSITMRQVDHSNINEHAGKPLAVISNKPSSYRSRSDWQEVSAVHTEKPVNWCHVYVMEGNPSDRSRDRLMRLFVEMIYGDTAIFNLIPVDLILSLKDVDLKTAIGTIRDTLKYCSVTLLNLTGGKFDLSLPFKVLHGQFNSALCCVLYREGGNLKLVNCIPDLKKANELKELEIEGLSDTFDFVLPIPGWNIPGHLFERLTSGDK